MTDRFRSLAPLALTLFALACGDGERNADLDGGADTAPAAPADPAGGLTITGDFQTPESVLHDPAADVYLVSNIQGAPLEKDGNGFISRVAPDGTVQQLKWIDGAADGVRLSAPKGMAIIGDSLFVSDIDTVRIFHRETGQPLGQWGVQDATFLNDLASSGGRLYVTDTGMRMGAEGFEPAGTDAVYRFDSNGSPTSLASGDALSAPNGIVADGPGMVVATFGADQLIRIDANGQSSSIATLPAGQLDGLERLQDGSFLVSSWAGSAVYRVRPGGDAQVVAEGVEAPADIGWDARRSRVLIPLFNGNQVVVREVAAEGAAAAGQTAGAEESP